MADSKPVKKSSNPIVFIGLGCLVLLVILGVVSSIAMKFFAKRIGIGLLQGAIEKNTGVKTNLQDIENGKMSFTDTKTGGKVDIGSGKIPDSFPKEFPVYPGATVVSAMSGAEKGTPNGFWVTLSTTDPVDKVSAFYKTALTQNGWTESASYVSGGTEVKTISRGTWSGTLSITQAQDKKETDIIIVLGEESATPTSTAPSSGE